MGYSIRYDPAWKIPESKNRKRTGRQWMTGGFLLALIILVRLCWPAGTESLRKILLPEGPAVQTVFEQMVSGICQGNSLDDEIATFCREVIRIE